MEIKVKNDNNWYETLEICNILKYTLRNREIIMKYTLLKCEIIMKYTLKYFFSTTYCTVKVGEEKPEKVHELS